MAPTQAPLSETLPAVVLEQPAVLTLRLDASETLGKPASPLLALLVFHTPTATDLVSYLWQKQLVHYGTWKGADVSEEQAAADMDTSDLLRLSVKFPSNMGAEHVEVIIVQEPQLHLAPLWAQAILPYIIPLDGEESGQPDLTKPQPLTPPKLARQIAEKYAYENGVDLNDELFECYGFDILPGSVRLLIRGVHSGETLPSREIYNATLRSVYAHLFRIEDALNELATAVGPSHVGGHNVPIELPDTALVSSADSIILALGSTVVTPEYATSTDLGVARTSLMPFFEYEGERFVPIGTYSTEEDSRLDTIDDGSKYKFASDFDWEAFTRAAGKINAANVDVFLAKNGKYYTSTITMGLVAFVGDINKLLPWVASK